MPLITPKEHVSKIRKAYEGGLFAMSHSFTQTSLLYGVHVEPKLCP